MVNRRGACWSGCVLMALLVWGGSTARGAVEVEAAAGAPFGVGRITVTQLGNTESMAAINGFSLEEADGRAYYPVFVSGRFQRLLGRIFGNEDLLAPGSITVHFLFTGYEPLDITVHADRPYRAQVRPETRNERQYERLLRQWWRSYSGQAREQVADSNYPPLVQSYLTNMLAQRLNLEPPLRTVVRQERENPDEAEQTLQLLLGLEGLRMAAMRETMAGLERIDERGLQAVPAPISWTPLRLPTLPESVPVEPIAMHVPEECFYIRFGNFLNYLWMNELSDEYGEIGNMVSRRGLAQPGNDRIEQQLGLRQSALAQILGPTVIEDVAIIGRDTFTSEGAAVGILFQARNTDVLRNDLSRQRTEAVRSQESRGATMRTVPIAGREVSFASTPDNRLRSFYAVDGNFHLVTTSRRLVEQFFEAGAGERSLGQSAQFRHARTILPLERNDAVFVYFSSAFFQGLLSPQYQIELRRRLQASTDIELVYMARWAARQERQPAETLEDLVAGGYLPASMARRADDSRPVLEGELVTDSLRGARGTFLPVPDVALEGVTANELATYDRLARVYQDEWKQLDPILVGVQRGARNEAGVEHVTIDAYMSPFAEDKYGWVTSILAPPTTEQIAPVPGDIISVQAVLSGGRLDPTIAPHHVFLGIQDSAPPASLPPGGLLKTMTILRSIPGYLGAWPKLGLLDRLPLVLTGRPDPAGYTRLPLGLWRREWNGFSVLSFYRPLLDWIPQQLQFTQADAPAQVRIEVGDLSQAQFAQWLRLLMYERALDLSQGNAELMHTISQQLGVPRTEARAAAETLLNAQLVCSLGGEYQLQQHRGGLSVWQSTAWSDITGSTVPEAYQPPLLDWFRGLHSTLIKQEDRLVIHTELDMQRKARENPLQLPFLNLFGGQKPATPAPAPAAEEVPAPADESTQRRKF